ncbi:D-lactate dehydrogenase [Anaerohalosphaera lusitana]|uniref:D-lactate dehydrogenase n=1 Tax=Anaerohalosphaera lusitana TaxID=1936003 RepID=A0A1U9NQM3_9BACT|nr:2-hydroxyacid dehydrogenase [Anaerohalosphaera lusitana]AQT70233.1 D-lactate dehydrogenase [Anaerohalosphaera lusitana]
MKVAVFSTKPYDQRYFSNTNDGFGHEFTFFEEKLDMNTVRLANGHGGVCVFVNDVLDRDVLKQLADQGIKLVALRCAGFNNVDIEAAEEFGMHVVRVPAYSPHAVAEHTITLILALNRRINKSHARIREGNFALDGLMGFDLNDHPVGIVGTGKIGEIVARILHGFGCKLYAFDPKPSPVCEELGVEYVSLDELFQKSYIVTLHCPLMPQTHHIIDAEAISKMQECVMLINTSRGALIDTKAVIDGLKSRKIGYLGIDVYEEEGDLFFKDLSDEIIQDDQFARLLMFPNVMVTAHQAFFTHQAVQAIADTTLQNISEIEKGERCENEVTSELVKS